jgi:hypothetical protein
MTNPATHVNRTLAAHTLLDHDIKASLIVLAVKAGKVDPLQALEQIQQLRRQAVEQGTKHVANIEAREGAGTPVLSGQGLLHPQTVNNILADEADRQLEARTAAGWDLEW